jgi:hypothetical protein
MNACKWSSGTDPLIRNLDTRWRWVVSIAPRPLWLWISTPVAIDYELGGLQDRPGWLGKEKDLLPQPGFESQPAQPNLCAHYDTPPPKTHNYHEQSEEWHVAKLTSEPDVVSKDTTQESETSWTSNTASPGTAKDCSLSVRHVIHKFPSLKQ